ncbi:MAG: UDP-2,3-diacylglucosamine diphosphatase LpxI domain-containing protein [Pirellula sp.]
MKWYVPMLIHLTQERRTCMALFWRSAKQDMQFDLPTIGPRTSEAMKRAGGTYNRHRLLRCWSA